MRSAEEKTKWGQLQRKRSRQAARPVESQLVSDHVFDLALPCTVIGGRNGSGKSRVLRDLAQVIGTESVYLDLHYLCEQVLMILRSREDFEEMTAEYSAAGPDSDRLDDVERVVGRDYESVEWFALEVEPHDPATAARFCWAGGQPLVPYFRVQYKGRTYTGRDMGLGEFSVHLLFWILEQYRESKSVTILLDEADAYLPPVGIASLYARLLRLCDERSWQIIATSHSEELIEQAVENGAFVLLSDDGTGGIAAKHSVEDATIADALLARPRIEKVYFCEDESAYHVLRALLRSVGQGHAKRSLAVWTGGSGALSELRKCLPRPPRPEISFALVFDGDQRAHVLASSEKQWPALFLPLDDPDTALRTLKSNPDLLAERLAVPVEDLRRALSELEGHDSHDWVNGLSDRFGRLLVLERLAAIWCELNEDAVASFGEAVSGSST